MLSFDIRSLDVQAATVDAYLSADDPIWQDGDPKPSRPARITGRISSAGPGRYYWHGRFEGNTTVPCRRCLEETEVPIQGELHLIFVESGDEEVENADVYALGPRSTELDLRPAIRENWLLEAPTFVVCGESCKGLCPTCGVDLNRSSCDCVAPARQVDPRWAALHKAYSE